MKNNLRIFKNDRAGQKVMKHGKPIEYNGKPIIESDLNAMITLTEPLQAGEYRASLYKRTSEKGTTYFLGNIKEVFKPIDKHNEAKANGYQKETIGLVRQTIEDVELTDDEIPF